MNIIINTRLLIKNKLDGIGRFTLETLKRITQNNPKTTFHFIFDRKYSKEFIFSQNVIPHILYPPTKHPILWYIWFEIQLPKLIRSLNADIFFSPDGFIPTKSINIPIVTTIHDINFEHRPKDLIWSHSLFYRHYFKKYATICDRIITVSEFSKNDIIKHYNIKSHKIDVVYNGVSTDFKKISEDVKREICDRYSNGNEFFIFIGSLHRRKNIKNLLLAFDQYKQTGSDINLIIAGENKWLDLEAKNIYHNMKYKSNVFFLGKISENILPKILGSAKSLCFISLFEGFGLPIIEAMKSGVPVITSNRSSMPEIANNAALIVDPFNIDEIAKAMSEMDINNQKRMELIKLGDQQVIKFDWDQSAKKMWNIMKSVHESK